MESYGTSMVAEKRSREDTLATEILNSTVKFNGDRYEVGLLWNEKHSPLSNIFASALGQLRRLKRRLNNDLPLETKYRATKMSDIRKRICFGPIFR